MKGREGKKKKEAQTKNKLVNIQTPIKCQINFNSFKLGASDDLHRHISELPRWQELMQNGRTMYKN
jgi:hypothetical protein